jgi:hypothetical protein
MEISALIIVGLIYNLTPKLKTSSWVAGAMYPLVYSFLVKNNMHCICEYIGFIHITQT